MSEGPHMPTPILHIGGKRPAGYRHASYTNGGGVFVPFWAVVLFAALSMGAEAVCRVQRVVLPCLYEAPRYTAAAAAVLMGTVQRQK